jgi:tryptophan-rich sensory protein
MNTTQKKYQKLLKPKWAPPAWVFGPAWSVLYVIIAMSFGSVIYQYTQEKISFIILLPFILNLIFNFIFNPILFWLENVVLAAIDALLILVTLLWALIVIFPIIPWVAYSNIPYLLWVSFATVLQFTVAYLHRK